MSSKSPNTMAGAQAFSCILKGNKYIKKSGRVGVKIKILVIKSILR